MRAERKMAGKDEMDWNGKGIGLGMGPVRTKEGIIESTALTRQDSSFIAQRDKLDSPTFQSL
jgi:hypothetical protein